jgi:hypothetical protein
MGSLISEQSIDCSFIGLLSLAEWREAQGAGHKEIDSRGRRIKGLTDMHPLFAVLDSSPAPCALHLGPNHTKKDAMVRNGILHASSNYIYDSSIG